MSDSLFKEWRDIRRMKRLNQELYDLLGGAMIYILEYSKKYNIPIRNYDHIKRMADRIHLVIDEINELSDDDIQSDKNKSSDEEEYRAQFRVLLT
jgi:hypothetical protein